MFVEHKEVGEVIEQPAKVLKLSEAIRIGAKMHPQGFGEFLKHGATCAMGAAAMARGWDGRSNPYKFLPEADDRIHISEDWVCLIGGRIANMNDGEKMTREQIADWLEELGY